MRVSPSTFTDPLLLRWQKFIKNKKSDEGGRGLIYAEAEIERRTQGKRSNSYP